MYIHRFLEKEVAPFLERREFLAILGPRQAGKTTFLKYLESVLSKQKKSVKFLTFEKKGDLNLFQQSIDDFKDLCRPYEFVIIDEFQYAEDGGQKLKYLYDTAKTKYIISGSASLELNFQVGKYMVGRIFKFALRPFSFREYLSFADRELYDLIQERLPPDIFNLDISKAFGPELNFKLEKLFENYLIFGGYPAVALAKSAAEKQKILESILENYLLKDVRTLLRLATEDELIRLTKFLAAQIGNLIQYKELSNVSGLNYKRLLKHLEILKQTYIVDFLKPFFTNRRTELTKNPKVYFIDSGLRNFTISDFRDFSSRNDSGSIVENYIFNSLLKTIRPLERFNFWRTKSGAEVDFIVSKKQSLVPIEVRYSAEPSLGKSFYSFIDKFSPKEGFILTKGISKKQKIKNCLIKFIPIYYL